MNGLPVHHAEEAVHLALPRPSIWPLLLSAALCVLVVGLLLVDQAPWLVLLAALFVFAGILGWALEDREPEPIDKHETLILPTAPLKIEHTGDGPAPLKQSKGKSQFKKINDLFHEE